MWKALGVTCLAVVIAVACYLVATQPPSFKEWAQKAPMETARLKSGQIAEDLIKERVPADIREVGDMTGVVAIIGQRQSRNIGTMDVGVDFKLPIPYNEWHK